MDNKIETIDVIVLADSRGESLLPLTQRTCAALLPVCGKPTIEHVLEALIPVPTRKIKIFISGHSGQIRKFLGTGSRWGLDIQVIATRGNSLPSDAFARQQDSQSRPCLVIDTRIFTVASMNSVINTFLSQTEPLLRGIHNGRDTGLHFLTGGISTSLTPSDMTPMPIELNVEFTRNIESLENYHGVNLALANSMPHLLILRGSESSPGIRTGTGCKIQVNNLEKGRLIAGRNCQLHDSVVCSGTVVLGHNVVIDRHSTLVDSLILEHSFISEHLHIQNAIVWGNSLIRIDSNASITLQDDLLLSNLSKSAITLRINNALAGFTAILILVLSMPLWVIAILDASLSNPRSLIRRYNYIGNSDTANKPHLSRTTFAFKTRFKSLQHLPLLLDLLRGRVKWFGVSLLSPEKLLNRTESWQFARDDYPVGLLGPAQTELDKLSSADDILMSDATFPGFTRVQLLKSAFKKIFDTAYDSEALSKINSR